MNRVTLALIGAALLVATGCTSALPQTPAVPAPQSADVAPAAAASPAGVGGKTDVSLNTSGGVQVKTDGDTTTVKVPGLSINVNKDNTASVQAPGLSISTAGGGSMIPKSGIVITENNLTQSFDCKGEAVVVNGKTCNVTFTGTVSSIAVSGSGNKVVLAGTVPNIVVTGDNNTVTWSGAKNPTPPIVVNHGKTNQVTRIP